MRAEGYSNGSQVVNCIMIRRTRKSLARSKLPPRSALQFQTMIATFSWCAEIGSSLLVVHDYQVCVDRIR